MYYLPPSAKLLISFCHRYFLTDTFSITFVQLKEIFSTCFSSQDWPTYATSSQSLLADPWATVKKAGYIHNILKG